MVRLINIKRNDGLISCNAIVEDCKKPVALSLDERTGQLRKADLPEGYEYCTTHIGFAERYLKSLAGENSIPESKTIMWY